MSKFDFLENATKKHLELNLFRACKDGKKDLAEYLLAGRVDVDVKMRKKTPLMECAKAGHGDLVQLLLEKGADINYEDWVSPTAFTLACAHGHDKVAVMLVEMGGKFGDYRNSHKTEFHKACKVGNLQTVNLLINQVFYLDEHKFAYAEGLSLAAENGHESVVELLLQHKNDPEKFSRDHLTEGLRKAAEKGNEKIVEMLLKHGALVDKHVGYNTVLMEACSGGHVGVVTLLLKAGADVNLKGWYDNTPLMRACEAGSKDIVRLLLERGADVNARQEGYKKSALFFACEKASKDVIELLVEHGADVNLKYGFNTPLMVACERKDCFDIFEFLVEKGSDMDNAFWNALQGGCIDVVRVFLERGFFVHNEKKGYLNESAVNLLLDGNAKMMPFVRESLFLNCDLFDQLIRACEDGHVDIVKLVLKHGADVNRQRVTGQTALMNACLEGHEEVVDALLDHGAEVNAKVPSTGETALYYAFTWEKFDIAKLLLRRGASFDKEHKTCKDMVASAVHCGMVQMLKEMLDLGVDVTHESQKGDELLWVACEKGFKNVAALLIEKGLPQENSFVEACKRGFADVVEAMIQRGVDVNKKVETHPYCPLITASVKGHAQVVELLLNAGADLDCVEEGGTALTHACEWKHEKVVEILVKRGANFYTTKMVSIRESLFVLVRMDMQTA